MIVRSMNKEQETIELVDSADHKGDLVVKPRTVFLEDFNAHWKSKGWRRPKVFYRYAIVPE